MKTTYLLLALSIMLFSCSFDEQEAPEEVPEKNFYALSVGNSWVYKYYTKDSDTDEFSVFAHKTDSVKIVGTKEFDENTYYEFYSKSVQTENNNISGFNIGEFEKTRYLRDSLGYLIDNEGNTDYWNNYFQERLHHSIIYQSGSLDVYGKLNETTTDLTIEAGSFECNNLEIYVKDPDTNEPKPTASYFYYADGVGNVCEKIGYISGGIIAYERRLDSYEVD